jgi:hypothetical protein
MGFNKRIITTECILDRFNEGGTPSVLRLFTADALIFHGDNQEDISKIFKSILEKNYSDTRKHIAELYDKTKS